MEPTAQEVGSLNTVQDIATWAGMEEGELGSFAALAGFTRDQLAAALPRVLVCLPKDMCTAAVSTWQIGSAGAFMRYSVIGKNFQPGADHR